MTQYAPTPAEIETLRNNIRKAENVADSLAILDRLSPPAPEVDEATVWTRKVMDANWSYWGPNAEMRSEIIRQVLSELIASKDAEIELERGRFKIADEEVDNLRRELVAVRAEKADFLWRRRAEKAESELATLQAENEGLKDTLNTLGTRWALRKAAERNTAEPEHCLSGEPHRKAGEVVRSAGLHSSDGSGNTAEAEARGRLEALEEIKGNYILDSRNALG